AARQFYPVGNDGVNDNQKRQRQDRGGNPGLAHNDKADDQGNRHGKKNSDDGRFDGAELEGGKVEWRVGNDRLLDGDRDGQDSRHVAGNSHEADMAEIHHVGIAHEHLKTDHQDDVDQEQVDDALRRSAAKRDDQHRDEDREERRERGTLEGMLQVGHWSLSPNWCLVPSSPWGLHTRMMETSANTNASL